MAIPGGLGNQSYAFDLLSSTAEACSRSAPFRAIAQASFRFTAATIGREDWAQSSRKKAKVRDVTASVKVRRQPRIDETDAGQLDVACIPRDQCEIVDNRCGRNQRIDHGKTPGT